MWDLGIRVRITCCRACFTIFFMYRKRSINNTELKKKNFNSGIGNTLTRVITNFYEYYQLEETYDLFTYGFIKFYINIKINIQ